MVSVPSFPNAPIMNMKQASLVKASLFSLKPFHQTIPKKYYFQGGSTQHLTQQHRSGP